MFKHKADPPIESIIVMHETWFQMLAGYDCTRIFQLPEDYWHPSDNLPNGMEGLIEPLETINVQQGPPDWVSGKGGMT